MDITSKRSLVAIRREDLNLAKEEKEDAKRMENNKLKANQRVRKPNSAGRIGFDHSRVMTINHNLVDALDHRAKETNLKTGANLVHLRLDLLVWETD